MNKKLITVMAQAWTLLGLARAGAWIAPDAHHNEVLLPVVFRAEESEFLTTACFVVTERSYPAVSRWTGFGTSADAAEKTFDAVVAAVKGKDKPALYRLSDPNRGRDQEKFDKQAAAFFRQFEQIEIISVPHAYEFDGDVVFFPVLELQGRKFVAPFVFSIQSDASFLFLPYRTENLVYRLVEAWYNSAWGPGVANQPSYCNSAEVRHAKYRVRLETSPGVVNMSGLAGRTSLIFNAFSLERKGAPAELAAKVESALGELKAGLKAGKLGSTLKRMSPTASERLRTWYSTASPSEREAFERSVLDRKPVFVIDASPLIVVYTRVPSGVLQHMFFVLNSSGELIWTNSFHITTADQVFNNSSVMALASPVEVGKPMQ